MRVRAHKVGLRRMYIVPYYYNNVVGWEIAMM